MLSTGFSLDQLMELAGVSPLESDELLKCRDEFSTAPRRYVYILLRLCAVNEISYSSYSVFRHAIDVICDVRCDDLVIHDLLKTGEKSDLKPLYVRSPIRPIGR